MGGKERETSSSESDSADQQPNGKGQDREFLDATLTALPAFVARVDVNSLITYLNQAVPGIDLQDVIGQPVDNFVSPEYHDEHRRALSRARQTGALQRFVVEGAGPHDTTVFWESNVVPVGGPGDDPDVAILSFDVTEHIQRARALETSEETLRIAIAATGLGLWSLDLKTGEVAWNQRMHEITGCENPTSQEEWTSLVHPEDRAEVEKGFAGIATGHPKYVIHRIIRKDGEVRWLLPTGQVTRNDAGEVIRMRGGVLDVTEQRNLEDSVRRAQRLESVGNLSAGIAHNFNNMLTVIQSAIEHTLATVQGADDKHHAVLRDAAHATNRAADLVSQLMRFAGQQPTTGRVSAQVSPIVVSATSLCRRTFDRRIRLDVSTHSHPERIRCNATEIEQVLVNLLINARDAIEEAEPTAPAITLTVDGASATRPDEPGPSKPHLHITVTDNGTGMPPAVLDQILDPFFTTKAPNRGTGLGLASSYQIVRQHGGWLAFSSVEGESTTVELYLPAADAPGHATTDQATEPECRRARILLVDDEDTVRRIVSLLLEDAGHTVTSAENALRALELLEVETPDLIFLDRSMPGLSPRRAVEEIRARIPSVPIVFFTGQSVPDEEKGMVDGVLTKPVKLDEIERMIGRLLSRPSGS